MEHHIGNLNPCKYVNEHVFFFEACVSVGVMVSVTLSPFISEAQMDVAFVM